MVRFQKKLRVVYDLMILASWISFTFTSIFVFYTTDQLYFKMVSLIDAIFLIVLGIFWLTITLIASVIGIIMRKGLAHTVECGADIAQEFQKTFLNSDFNEWELQKLVLMRRIRREVLQIFFLLDMYNAKQDISRVSHFLFFWKEIRFRVDFIVKAMNEVEWVQNRLTANNYLKVNTTLVELDCILRSYPYWDQTFLFLSEEMVRQKHRKELQSLLNNVVIPEDRKQSYVLKAMSKTLMSFDQNLKQKLEKRNHIKEF